MKGAAALNKLKAHGIVSAQSNSPGIMGGPTSYFESTPLGRSNPFVGISGVVFSACSCCRRRRGLFRKDLQLVRPAPHSFPRAFLDAVCQPDPRHGHATARISAGAVGGELLTEQFEEREAPGHLLGHVE